MSPDREPLPKIALLAVLANLDSAYSVAGVVLSQARALIEYGYPVRLITTDDFASHHSLPKEVEVCTYPRYTSGVSLDRAERVNLDHYVAITSRLLSRHLKDIDVCITHDVMFIHDFAPVNLAVRRIAPELPLVRWLHWVHSLPSPPPCDVEYPLTACYAPIECGELVYVNRSDVRRVAERYSMPEASVRVVHNWFDWEDALNLHPLSKEILKLVRISTRDTVCVYPTRLSKAKQVEKAVRLVAALRRLGTDACLIICNSYSNAEREQEYAAELRALAVSLGLGDNLVITSSLASRWAGRSGHDLKKGLPHRVVLDLLRLADLFILPSLSEGCSVTMLEAAFNKNFMVLNEDLSCTQEFAGQRVSRYGTDRAMLLSFGSVTRPLLEYLPSEDAWFAPEPSPSPSGSATGRTAQPTSSWTVTP